MALTDSQIRGFVPEGRKGRLADGGGLYIEALASGSKTWRLKYRLDGKQRDIKLGAYPALRLNDARLKREMAKSLLAEGRDPALLVDAKPAPAAAVEVPPEAEPEPPAREPIFAAEPIPEDPSLWKALAEKYRQYRIEDGMHYRTRAKLERQIRWTVEALGEKRVGDITAQDILALVRPIAAEGKRETAHEVRSRCSQIFDFAAGEGFDNNNPARIVVKAMVRRKRGKFPGLAEPAAVGKLMRDIRAFDRAEPQVLAGLLLSAYLFPRNDQLRGMTWDEVDLDNAMWEIPGARMKGERAQDQLVPLPRQAVSIIRQIGQFTGRSKYVLPSPRGEDMKLSDPVFNVALRKMGYCTRTQHCHHGFRTTASTNLNEMGFNRDWIERQLAHVDDDTVRAGYNKAQYIAGRIQMMQDYADWLDRTEAGAAAEGRAA